MFIRSHHPPPLLHNVATVRLWLQKRGLFSSSYPSINLCCKKVGGASPERSKDNRATFLSGSLGASLRQILALVSSSGPAAKRKCQAGRKFKVSWKLPVGITASSKGAECHCKLCMRDFSIAHGGFNDGPIHQQRFKDSGSTKS